MIHTDCGNRGDDLAKLELVENGGLAGSVQSDHQNAHFRLAEQPLEQTLEGPHSVYVRVSARKSRMRTGPNMLGCHWVWRETARLLTEARTILGNQIGKCQRVKTFVVC